MRQGILLVAIFFLASSHLILASRSKRDFPAAKSSKCSYEKEALNDVVEILKTISETNEISASESARIYQSYSSKYGSDDNCEVLIHNILANCKDIVDLRKNGKLEELEDKLKQLQLNLDSVERNARQSEATLKKRLEDVREELKQQLKQAELQRQQLEKENENSVQRLVMVYLQDGDFNIAVKEFEALKHRNDLVPEFVKSAHSNSKVKLLVLAKFVCKISYFSTAYFAINALYEEMAKKNQLEAKEMVLLYLRLKILADNESFPIQPLTDRNKILELTQNFEPHNLKILTSLVNDIKREAFQRPIAVHEVAISILNGEQLFQADLVKLYFDLNNLSQFPHLYNFINDLPHWSNRCYAYAATWKELNARGNGDSMEALAVWSHSSEIAKMRRVTDAQCLQISNSKTPAYNYTLVYNYNSNIKFVRTDNIRDLHIKYKMNFFFSDYISSLSIYEMQNDKFDRLIKAIEHLPYLADRCFAVKAVYEKFKHAAMLGMFEHFLTLRVIKAVKSSSNYASMDAFSKSLCETASQDTPNAFKKLLNEETSNCKLKNRHFDEPLYCTSDQHMEHGYRRILTWIPNEDDDDQYWSINISKEQYGVYIRNKDRSNMDIRYIQGTVRGSSANLDKQTDYFRIDTIDGYVLLQPTSEKVYVAASDEIWKIKKNERRFVKMMNDFNDHRTHWNLICK